MSPILFRCARCTVSTFHDQSDIEHDHGDWIIRCRECGTANILATQIIGKIPVPIFDAVGWKD